MVHRSALVLKLLISRKYGSLIAAPTFSLPETIGGVRNWDYRFTWLRDATFTLYALTRLGFVDETEAFIEWLKGRLSDDAPAVSGHVRRRRRQDLEEILDQFCGYENSRPVRISNAAYKQLQLDIYGEMMDSVTSGRVAGPLRGWQVFTVCWSGCGTIGGVRMKVSGGARWAQGVPAFTSHVLGGIRSRCDRQAVAGAFDVWQATRRNPNDVFTISGALNWNVRASQGTNDLMPPLLMPMMQFMAVVDGFTMKAIEEQLISTGTALSGRTHRVDGLLRARGFSRPARSGTSNAWLMRVSWKGQLLFGCWATNHLSLYSEELVLRAAS
jgi:hypothetical protein